MYPIPPSRGQQVFQEFLLALFPGLDVLAKVKPHRRYGALSGFWVWDLVKMEHVHTSKREISVRYPTIEAYKAYTGSIKVCKTRWPSVVAQLKKNE